MGIAGIFDRQDAVAFLARGAGHVAQGLLAAQAHAQDPLDNWHHWRGPIATGVAPKANPPIKWDADTNIKWKTPLAGRGSATPIVWSGWIVITRQLYRSRRAV